MNLSSKAVALLLGTTLAIFPGSVGLAQPALLAQAHPELWPAGQSVGLVDPATEKRITLLMARMSLEEKVGQLIQADIETIKPADLREYPLGSILAGGNSGPNGNERSTGADWLKLVRSFREVSTEARPGHTAIPIIFGVDAVHGHNNVPGATIFPHNIALGAAHEPALVRRIGAATAEEVAATGIEWIFAPTLAVPQDPRWGRTYEGYSDGPDLVAAYAGPMVEGLQGSAGRPRIAATAKHFVADGGTAAGVDQGDALVTESELIDVHVAGYAPAIKAGVLTVMASYSSWQGQKMHGNRQLLTDVLKGRMGFQGFVIGDWNGHGQVPGCSNESCPVAVNAGVDMLMAPDSWRGLYKNTLAQARSGEIPMARIDDAVRRILRVKIKLGLFEGGRPGEGQFERIGTAQHRDLAREAVRKSLVLLKNNGVLPVRPGANVLVAGDGADSVAMQTGGWTISWQGSDTALTDFPNATTVFSGLKTAIEGSGGSAQLSPSGAFQAKPDVAIVVFGEAPYAEMLGDIKSASYQPRSALRTLQTLKAAGVPTVAVFLSGRPLWVDPELAAADAFVAAWLPGTEAGGIADVLVAGRNGHPRFDFTGKLSFNWPAAPLPAAPSGRWEIRFKRGYGLSYER